MKTITTYEVDSNMSLSLIIDLLGIGVVFWAIGRLCFHLALLDFDKGHITRKSRIFYILTWVFYILGNFSSLIIGGIDGMCHKRLYYNYLENLHRMKSYVPHNINKKDEFENFCKEHDIGPDDSLAPLDIPFSWYTLY